MVHRNELGVACNLARPLISQGVVKETDHVHLQSNACSRQLRLYYFAVVELTAGFPEYGIDRRPDP